MDNITDQLIIDKKDGVGRITFDNQARRNALTYEMWQGIPIVMADFADDDAVRVIVFAGAGGKAFSAGADISEFAKKRSGEDAVAIYNEAVAEATDALVDAKKPLLAKIDGFCVGGGLGVAMTCDLRIAAADSRFAVPAAKLGLGYKMQGLKILVDQVGPAAAKEIFFTARQFDAEEALQMGLVNRVLP
ncbi:MAG TPA: enoyl-CoA hydratase-related protein, partial [Rhodospirillales bacterium]|nr:enoyl-CoA hydratase-related protein [Rhodospirillales bacterium]